MFYHKKQHKSKESFSLFKVTGENAHMGLSYKSVMMGPLFHLFVTDSRFLLLIIFCVDHLCTKTIKVR